MTTMEHLRIPKVLLMANTAAEDLPTFPEIRQLLVGHALKGRTTTAVVSPVGTQPVFDRTGSVRGSRIFTKAAAFCSGLLLWGMDP